MKNFRRLALLCLVPVLLFSGCSEKSNQEKQDTIASSQHESEDYEDKAKNAAVALLESRLKNPESLQIHSVSFEGDTYENDLSFFCTVVIDYSAQNGFGGYNRENIELYLTIDKASDAADVLDKTAYINRFVDAQFGDGLRSIAVDVPMDYICKENCYAQLCSEITNKGKAFSTFAHEDGARELECIANLGEMEGTASYYFYPDSEELMQINFFWSNGQSFYDGTNFHTLGTNYIATLDDVEELQTELDTSLGLSHGTIKEGKEPSFHNYECIWTLAEGVYIKLSWTTSDLDASIGHIQVLLCNDVNGKA